MVEKFDCVGVGYEGTLTSSAWEGRRNESGMSKEVDEERDSMANKPRSPSPVGGDECGP